MTTLARFPALLSAALAGIAPSIAATSIASDGTVPPIFVTTPPATPSATAALPPFFPSAKPMSALSERLRTQIAAGGLRDDRVLSYDPTLALAPALPANPAVENSEVITMDRFIVRAEKAPVVLRPVGEPRPFLDALKTGKLYHSVGKGFTADISLWASNMGSPSSDSPANGSRLTPTIPRIELAIRFSW